MKKEDCILRVKSVEIIRMLDMCSTVFRPSDIDYRCPTEQWLIDVVGEQYDMIARSFGLDTYQPPEWLCDERAMLFCGLARTVHNEEFYDYPVGLAVGLAKYHKDGSSVNTKQICWAIADRSGERKMVFIDPGSNPSLLSLSESEKKSLEEFYV